jgi:hypothetical protein
LAGSTSLASSDRIFAAFATLTLPHYREQVLARAQSAALTTTPFAERMVHF